MSNGLNILNGLNEFDLLLTATLGIISKRYDTNATKIQLNFTSGAVFPLLPLFDLLSQKYIFLFQI